MNKMKKKLNEKKIEDLKKKVKRTAHLCPTTEYHK